MKRAELVLKCIKGFMIEFVQWGSQDSKTLQFVVPQVTYLKEQYVKVNTEYSLKLF